MNNKTFGTDQLAAPSTMADLFDDPDYEIDERSAGKRAQEIFLPENSTDRFLTLGATALVAAVLFQYLLFPGFGFAKRVLPLLVPAPITQAIKYLVPDDVKETLAEIVPGAERIRRIVEGNEIPVPDPVVPTPDTAPPTTIPETVVIPDPLILADLPVPMDLTLPVGAPLAAGDWFQRSATLSVSGYQEFWDINVRAGSSSVNQFSSGLALQTEFCSRPWVQTSASPQRWVCNGSSPYPTVTTTFGSPTTRVVSKASKTQPLYLRFIVSFADSGEINNGAVGQSSSLSLEFSAVPSVG